MNPAIVAMIKHSGRSWWQARYWNGKVVSEWDTLATKLLLPFGKGSSSRWEEVPKKGMVGLRLLCPNGMCGELEAPDYYKFFQLKVGRIDVAMGKRNGTRQAHQVEAHIIGVVLDIMGNCFCRAWEHKEQQLIQFTDNVYNMKYRAIGRLSLDAQELKI